MNRLEKFIYDAVKSSPAIKFALRNIYQGVYDMLPSPSQYSAGKINYKENFFWGFHDRSPFSADETRLLACHTHIPVRMPGKDEAAEVGFFDFHADGTIGDFHKLGESYAWNYHKGCRLQWVDDNTVIYNTRKDSGLCSVVTSVDGSILRTMPYAIDTVSSDGCFATTFSYERLNILMPGYGYEYCEDGGCLDESAPANTGIGIMNINDGSYRMLVSLEELAAEVGHDNTSSFRHYVTHSEFSYDGRYVSFLHRWIGDDYRRRHTRMVVYDLADDKWFSLPTTGMVSHYVWTSDNRILAYCSVEQGDAHVLFDIPSCTYKTIMLGKVNSDGHQSMVPGLPVFITDTYPDKYRMASLYAIDISSSECTRIAYLRSPKKYQTKDFRNHIACDLHPRVSPSGRWVCFDSVFTGVRSLCVMKLDLKR